jgi:uncharacterized coiled-coil protein SlyX
MRHHVGTPIVLAFAVLLACGKGDDTTSRGRLDAVERRLDSLEQRLAAIDKELPTGERLRNDLHALEQRLGAVESKATQALERAKATPPPAPGAPSQGKQATAAPPERAHADAIQRREQLGALMTEYRRRLNEVRRSQPPGASPADQMAARRAVRDWYIARRRAIIAGKPLPE